MLGILTFHHVHNYGALLQAYALQSYLEQIGHKAIVLDIETFYRDPPAIAARGRTIRCIELLRRWMGSRTEDDSGRPFDEFRTNWLNLSEPLGSLNSYLQSAHEVDTVIVGSDQIWDPRYGKKALNTYFLKGVPISVKRISYAACAGSHFTRTADLCDYRESIRAFDSISVRDEFTRALVQPMASTAVEVVVDPVMLLDWDFVSTHGGEGQLPDEYILYYGQSLSGDHAIRRLKRRYGLPVVSLNISGISNEEHKGRDIDGNLIDISGVGPLEWVALFKRASIVVTRSFHGLMFALKFSKPVLVAPGDARGISRLKDACQRFGLDNCLTEYQDRIPDAVDGLEKLDLKRIQSNVEESIDNSRDYLDRALN